MMFVVEYFEVGTTSLESAEVDEGSMREPYGQLRTD
jgi:hypothetical protein